MLKDIFVQTEWPAVWEALRQYFPEEDICPDGCEAVYLQLQSLPARVTPLRLVLEPKDGPEPWIDVLGSDGTAARGGGEVRYWLDFEPWEVWLGMTVDEDLRQTFSAAQIAALCLYEMTFYGYTQNDIRQKAGQLRQRSEEFDECAPEDRDKTYPLAGEVEGYKVYRADMKRDVNPNA